MIKCFHLAGANDISGNLVDFVFEVDADADRVVVTQTVMGNEGPGQVGEQLLASGDLDFGRNVWRGAVECGAVRGNRDFELENEMYLNKRGS